MNNPTPYRSFSMSKIYCSIFGHNYEMTKKVTHHIKEYTCTHCGEQATTNSRGRLEKMTPKLKDINASLAKVHAKRLAKNNTNPQFKIAS